MNSFSSAQRARNWIRDCDFKHSPCYGKSIDEGTDFLFCAVDLQRSPHRFRCAQAHEQRQHRKITVISARRLRPTLPMSSHCQAAFHLNQSGTVRTVNAGPPNRTVVGIGTSSSALPIGDIGNLFQRVRCHCPRTEISASKILPCRDSQITTSYRNDCFDFLPTSQRCHP